MDKAGNKSERWPQARLEVPTLGEKQISCSYSEGLLSNTLLDQYEKRPRKNSEDDNEENRNVRKGSEYARSDRNGTLIVKDGKKKHNISFADQVEDQKQIADVYVVESYKKFNQENTYGRQSCCHIF